MRHARARTRFEDLELFALNWYKDRDSFQAYDGVDLNPARHKEYEFRGSTQWGKLKPLSASNRPPHWTSSADISLCTIKQSDGSYYRIQELGPFASTGGYDFWQFGWKDVFGLSEILTEHPRGIMADAAFSAAVLPDGTPLGLPPIHIHHIHVGQQIGVKAKEKSVPFLMMEQHGDYECTESDGGTRCLFEKTADGHGKVIREPLDLEGELNDVRAFNYPPITWYYRVMLRYRPYSPKSSALKPLSQSFFIGPSPIGDKQLNTLGTFPTPTAEESIYWYTGKMATDGKLVRNKLHSHNVAFNRALWFHANPGQLGIDKTKFSHLNRGSSGCRDSGAPWMGIPDHGCVPVPLSKSGFKDFESIENFLFRHLAAAQADDSEKSPKLVCEAVGARQSFSDPKLHTNFSYDRRASVCCKPWTFEKDDDFTVVAFLDRTTQPVGPSAPDTIPATVDMHIHWVISYEEDQEESLYRFKGAVNPAQQSYYFGPKYEYAQSLLQLRREEHLGQPANGILRTPVEQKKAEYVQIFGALLFFILGGYAAHKCSPASRPLMGSGSCFVKCCPPFTPQVKTRHVQYHTV